MSQPSFLFLLIYKYCKQCFDFKSISNIASKIFISLSFQMLYVTFLFHIIFKYSVQVSKFDFVFKHCMQACFLLKVTNLLMKLYFFICLKYCIEAFFKSNFANIRTKTLHACSFQTFSATFFGFKQMKAFDLSFFWTTKFGCLNCLNFEF